MTGCRSRISLLLTVACAITFAPLAQDAAKPRREAARGRITKADGAPWAGAIVVIVGWAFPDLPMVGVEDRVTVKSDARGRFRVRLLPNRRYSAWAYERLEDGTLREAAIVTSVHAGGSLRLVESEATRRFRTLKLDGLEPWQKKGPLRFRLCSAGELHALVDVEAQVREGELALPPWPATSLRIYGADDRLLLEQALSRVDESGRLALDPPILVRLKTKFREGGKPVVGADVVQPIDKRWVSIGRTDEKGVALLEPVLGADQRYLYLALLPKTGSLTLGRQLSFSRDARGRVIRPDDKAKDDDPDRAWLEHEIVCEKTGGAMSGRVMLGPDRPAANLELLYFVSCPTGQGSWHHRKEVFPVRCDAEGRFEIRGAPDRCEWRLFARSPDRDELLVLAVGAKPKRGALGDFVISDIPAVDIAVVERDGSPAKFAKIVLAGVRNAAGIGLYNDHSFDTNRRGRMRMRIADRSLLRVAAGLDGSYVQRDLAKAEDPSIVELKLGKRTTIGGRVVTPAGVPIAGAKVYYSVRRIGGPKDLLSRFSSSWKATTDADGNYSLSCPPNSLLRMHAYRERRGKKTWARSGTPQVEVEDGHAEVEDIVLDIGK